MPLPSVRVSWRVSYSDALPVGGRKQGGCADLPGFWRDVFLDAGDVEEGGGDSVSEEDAEDDDDAQYDVVAGV
jgi:hypothetical protein